MLIGIEDVVANALIELKQRENVNCVSITKVQSYGEAVAEELRLQDLNARFYVDRNLFEDFEYSYSKYFGIMKTGTDVMCYVKEGITIENLWEKFRGYLSVNAFLAFSNNEIFSATLMTQAKKQKKLSVGTSRK